MSTFKKILVPIDFEQHSDEAVRIAAALARDTGAAVVLAHAYDAEGDSYVNGYIVRTPEERNHVAADLQRHMDARRTLLQQSGVSHVETRLLNGKPAPELLRVAREGKFDLIVMGTHGRTGLWLQLLGSVAQTMLSEAPCPVLTVRCPDSTDTTDRERSQRYPLANAEPLSG